MMQDTSNEYPVRLDAVENSMAAMHDAANAATIVGPFLAAHRKPFEPRKHTINCALVSIGSVIPEPLRAKAVDLRKITARCRTQPDLRHAARGVRR